MTIFRVYGIPAPQGSKAFKGIRGGHAILVESSKEVKPWREAVKWAAIESKSVKTEGAVVVTINFFLPCPKSCTPASPPAKRPDLDKLIRSTMDALTDVGLIDDDSRVVKLVCQKFYATNSLPAGAVISIDKLKRY